MSESQRDISPGRRRVILGLTGLMGVMVTGCSFGGPGDPTSPLQGIVTTQTQTSGITPIVQGTTLYTYKGHTNWVNDLAWSPDSKWIASCPACSAYDPSSTNDYSIHIWDAATGQDHFTYQSSGANIFPILAWSLDGTRIAIPDDPRIATSSVSILDARSGKKLITCEVSHTVQIPDNYHIFQIIWSPDSSRIAATGVTDVTICNTGTGRKLLTYPAQPSASEHQASYAVAWSPDGNTIASAAQKSGHSVQFWDAHSGQPLHYFSGNRPYALAWSPEGSHLLIRTASKVQVQDVKTGQIIFSVSAGLPAVPEEKRSSPYSGAHPHTVSWSPDGKYIALADGQKQVQIWKVAAQSLEYTYREHTDLILAVAWAPDGSRVASAGVDQTVRVWQAL
jgi:WD40 repeat protein